MAFIKRTWLARIGTGLNKFIIGDKDGNNKQTLTNSPDTVSQQGDVISADNLNDLEDRIEAGLNEKQNTLTFDDVPTSGSNNPVKSGGVYTELAGKQNTLTFDNAPTLGSTNPVTSGGVFTALNGLRLTKIWENSSPSSDFASQEISIQNDNITDFVIEFSAEKRSSDSPSVFEHYKRETTIASFALSTFSSSRFVCTRSIVTAYYGFENPPRTSFNFLSGNAYNLFTQGSFEDHNEYCIPIAIYKVT